MYHMRHIQRIAIGVTISATGALRYSIGFPSERPLCGQVQQSINPNFEQDNVSSNNNKSTSIYLETFFLFFYFSLPGEEPPFRDDL